ncbi:MAG: prolyl oligopeptidase family serine peptidase [Opitutaceae bacterium]
MPTSHLARPIVALALALVFANPLLLAGVAPGDKRFTALDVFQLEYADDPQFAPDGGAVAYVRRSMDVMTDRVRASIWSVNVTTGEQRPLLSGRNNFSSPRWSPDGKRLAYLSAAEGSQQLHVRWMDSGQTALVTNLTEAPDSIAWSPDGEWIAFTMDVPKEAEPLAKPPSKPEGADWAKPVKVIDRVVYRSDGAGYLELAYAHVFVVPADGGTPRQLTSGDFNHNGPIAWTRDGRIILFSANRSEDWEYEIEISNLWSVDVASGELKQLNTRRGGSHQPVVSPDGKHIAYLGSEERGLSHQTTHLYSINGDGSNDRRLTGELDADAGSPQWRADSRGVYFQYDERGEKHVGFAALNGAIEKFEPTLGGLTIGRPYTSGAYSVSHDGTIAYTLARPDRPADLALFNPGSDERTRTLTTLNEDLLAHKELGKVEALTWKSSFDGREIHGWIVRPPSFDPEKKYPLILEIHGGPHTAYGPEFSAEIQRYAADGYIVLYANPRGSTSYGEEFANLIHHNYPGEDYDDLISGVDAVIARGHVDPEQLFVTGGSGGGVLTAWIVGKTNRFRAAAVVKPVINMTSFAFTTDYTPYFIKYWFGKFPWEDIENYWRRSPLSLAGNVTTPTLVMVGESDHRTPPGEAEQFYQALKLQKIETALVRVPESPHHIAARPSNLVAKVDNILAWFARYRTDKEEEEEENEKEKEKSD